MILPHACRKHARTLGSRPRRQTWARGGLAKADSPDTPDHEWLLEIADNAAPATKAAFLEALRRVRNAAKEAELRDAIARGDVNAAMRALGVEEGLSESLKPGLTKPLEDAFIAAGRATPAKTMGVHVGMSFNLTNPNTATFLRNYDFGLIRDISQQTRDGIRTVIQNAFAMGGHPYEQARQIRESIGLTDDQAQAVTNFENLLRTKDRAALTRAMRDRRHDPTLERALGAGADRTLSDEQIATMVNRYRNRAILNRAQMIARTETMRASNAAQNMAWGQAADQGLLNRTALRRFWLVTPDDRLCEYCEQVPDMNEDGVPLDGYFDTPYGPAMYGPLHPLCRCITYIDTGDADG